MFSSPPFEIRVNLLHPYPSSFLFGLFLRLPIVVFPRKQLLQGRFLSVESGKNNSNYRDVPPLKFLLVTSIRIKMFAITVKVAHFFIMACHLLDFNQPAETRISPNIHVSKGRYQYFSFLTIFLCFLHLYITLWSITNRSEGQNLKFKFCVLIKPSDIFTENCCIAYI